MFEALQRFVVEPTPRIERANYRTYVAFNVGALAASGIHLAILPLFWWLGATELLWLNILSQAAYLGALVANRRGRHATMMAFCLVELAVHQAACVHALGWATGFQYYLVVFPAFVFFLPGRRLGFQLATTAIAAAVFMGLYAFSLRATPVHAVAPAVAAATTYANVAGVFVLLGLFGWSFRHAADAAEAELAATERKLAEDRLVLLKAAVDAAADMIVITDASGIIEVVNPAFFAVLGYVVDDVLGRPMRGFLAAPPTSDDHLAMRAAVEAGRGWSGRLALRRKDGEVLKVASTVTPVRDGGGAIRHVLGILQDVTAADRAAERLAQAEEQLRQAKKMEAIGTLAGGIAHDFNNVLTVVLGCAAGLKETLAPDDPRLEEVVDIENAGERAAALTRQLLAYGRRQVLSPQVLDPNRVVRDIEKLLRRSVSERVELALRLSPDAPMVEADEAQLGQVLLNLAVNANDAMPDGGKLVIATERVAASERRRSGAFELPPGDYARIAVSDSGHGIDPEAMPRIFEPFFTTKAFGKGTGLGLATVYGIVAQSGGHLTVESEVDVGTTFEVFLPAKAASVRAAPTAERASLHPRGTETVLLVEDDAAVRGVADRILRSSGYRVVEATDGAEAVAFLDAYPDPVHVVVTDVMMPGLDGPSLAERARSSRPGVKIVFLSGYPGEVIAKHGRFVAGENFLAKPFSPAALATLVRRVLDA